ncbi:SusD family protein [Pedobacter steynii]|uniref:SusD family protein n=1 Tax=Pedobacter steynii TaxID=430522 RepID=A0A1G9W7W4_9SPHI|nr:RagB/SusD family nutrient uptake outer membrane protein [Pedobacter steynii]NQX40207.1 RagB/SusD family nutrient uptake outer membrane protein [Pedobacter steynii]SDM80570.1 SusD family protein [Pedobacter steynii]
MNKNIYILLLAVFSTLASCKKFLDEKPDKKLLVPKTLEDFQSLLDGNFEMNLASTSAGFVSADDYSLSADAYNRLEVDQRNLYTWQDKSFSEVRTNDWGSVYTQVYNANVALEGTAKINKTGFNEQSWNNVKGGALFFRGRAFFEAALIWAKAYDPASAATDPGIPLTMTSDFNVKTTRLNVQETYNQILNDLKQAADLLPANATHNIRPSKAAAYAYLSRVYLAMRDYPNAGKYADAALQLNNKLIDYADLDDTEFYPLPGITNPEIIMFFSMEVTFTPVIDQSLYDLYLNNDYRKTVFFEENRDGSMGFKGSYDGSYAYFTGVATDEMYLNRAESAARANKVNDAMDDLNTLLKKRIKGFVPLTATNQSDALRLILNERRKELVLRGTRWMDLKRLNKEPEFALTLKRTGGGKEYILAPNDPKYALPIPDQIIGKSGIAQNIR